MQTVESVSLGMLKRLNQEKIYLKSIHSVNSSAHLVFINSQLMSALASLERFGEEGLVFIN